MSMDNADDPGINEVIGVQDWDVAVAPLPDPVMRWLRIAAAAGWTTRVQYSLSVTSVIGLSAAVRQHVAQLGVRRDGDRATAVWCADLHAPDAWRWYGAEIITRIIRSTKTDGEYFDQVIGRLPMRISYAELGWFLGREEVTGPGRFEGISVDEVLMYRSTVNGVNRRRS